MKQRAVLVARALVVFLVAVLRTFLSFFTVGRMNVTGGVAVNVVYCEPASSSGTGSSAWPMMNGKDRNKYG